MTYKVTTNNKYDHMSVFDWEKSYKTFINHTHFSNQFNSKSGVLVIATSSQKPQIKYVQLNTQFMLILCMWHRRHHRCWFSRHKKIMCCTSETVSNCIKGINFRRNLGGWIIAYEKNPTIAQVYVYICVCVLKLKQ